MKKLDGFSKVLNFLNCYYSKKLTHKHEAPTKVSSEKVKAALQIQNAPKPSLSGIGNTSQTKVLTATLEKPETPSPTKKSPVTPDKKFQQHEPEKKMSAPRFVYIYLYSKYYQLFVYIFC